MRILNNQSKIALTALTVSILAGCNGGSDGGSGSDNPNNGGGGGGNNPSPNPQKPIPSVIVENLDFNGETSYEDEYYNYTVNYLNDGNVVLTGLNVVADGVYVESTTCSDSLAIGSSCVVNGAFRPNAENTTFDLSVTLQTNEAEDAVASAKSESREARLQLIQDRYLPKYSKKNDGPVVAAYTLHNHSDDERTGLNFVTNGSFENISIVDNNCGDSLGGHESCTFGVRNQTQNGKHAAGDVVGYTVNVTSNEGVSATRSESTTLANTSFYNTDQDSGINTVSGATFAEYMQPNETNELFIKAEVGIDNANIANVRADLDVSNGSFEVTTDHCSTKDGAGDCDMRWNITPSDTGPVKITVNYSWDEVDNEGAVIKSYTQSEVINNYALETVTLDTVVMDEARWTDKLAFTAEDIFKGKAHDNRYSLIYSQDMNKNENGGTAVSYYDTKDTWEKAFNDGRKMRFNDVKNGVDVTAKVVIEGEELDMNSAKHPNIDADVKEYYFARDNKVSPEIIDQPNGEVTMLLKQWNGPYTKKVVVPVEFIYVAE